MGSGENSVPLYVLTDTSVAYDATQVIEPPQLSAQNIAAVEVSVAVYAVENLVGAPRVQVVLRHEIQKLSEASTDLVYELRERDLTCDQTLASLRGLEFP